MFFAIFDIKKIILQPIGGIWMMYSFLNILFIQIYMKLPLKRRAKFNNRTRNHEIRLEIMKICRD